MLDCLCQIGHSAKGKYASDSLEFARTISKELNRTSKDIVENISDIFRYKYHLKYEEICEMILRIFDECTINEEWFNALAKEVDFDGFLEVLYEVGFVGDFVLGGEGGSRTFYSFTDRHEPGFKEIQIHPCFRKAVNTVDRIRT